MFKNGGIHIMNNSKKANFVHFMKQDDNFIGS